MIHDQLPEGVTREEMEADIVIVGGGSAGLSCALHLQNQIQKHNDDVAQGKKSGNPIPEQMIIVLEKGSEVGAHSFSGAVLDPIALKELVPDFKEQGCPLETEVKKDAVYYLGNDFSFKLPITPPNFHNEGSYIVSLSQLNRWLASQCEAKGINIFPGFAAVEALYDGDKIIGVRTGDKGREKDGTPKSNFEPGLILKSKLVIFAEGTRGSLFKQVSNKLNLRANSQPDVYEEGVKEIIQLPPGSIEAGQVIHTMGYPLKKSIGGTFIYTLPNDRVIVGLVAYLDTQDPLLDPHRELQKFKMHPFMQKMLKGGKVIAYGGKTLPAGGWYSMPKLSGHGWMVVGDSANMVDVQRLKGIHHSMKSGMLAAETAIESILAGDFSATATQKYQSKIEGSFVKTQLYKVRNFHQALSKGMIAGLPLIAAQELTGGAGFMDPMPIPHTDAQTTQSVVETWGPEAVAHPDNQLPKVDNVLIMDKLSSVYLSGTMHDEHSPNHLILKDGDVCRTVCEPKFKSPCTFFCPASVYEMLPSQKGAGQYDLQINYTNCIHCKTCDIKCPFENIDWTVPEGGGGPQYRET